MNINESHSWRFKDIIIPSESSLLGVEPDKHENYTKLISLSENKWYW